MYSVWPLQLEEASGEDAGRPLFTVAGTLLEVEDAALAHLRLSGTEGVFSGNETWWKLAFLLFHDQIYAPLDGAYEPDAGPFPGPAQDIPQDLFTSSFYPRRQSQFENRFQELAHKGVQDELRQAIQAYRSSPSRLLHGLTEEVQSQLEFIATNLDTDAVLAVCKRLLVDFAENRPGLPDLFLVKDDQPIFAEVKSSRDRLSEQQTNWLDFLERTAKVKTAVVTVNHSESQTKRLLRGRSVHGKPVTLRFGKSTSKNYPKAVQLARTHSSYRDLTDHPHKLLHEVTIATDDISRLMEMLDMVYRWKGTEIRFDGQLISSTEMRLPLNCYRDRVGESAGDSWCERDPDSGDKYLCGCRHLRLEDFYEGTMSWTEYGYIDSETHEFVVRKDQIEQELRAQIPTLRLCPVFDEKRARKPIGALPSRVTPGADKGWAYEVDGTKWFLTKRGWVDECGDTDFPGASSATGAAQYSSREVREALEHLREGERTEREWARLGQETGRTVEKVQRSGCVILVAALVWLPGALVYVVFTV